MHHHDRDGDRESGSLWSAEPSSRRATLRSAKIPGLEDKIAQLVIGPCPEEDLRPFRTPVTAETLNRTIG